MNADTLKKANALQYEIYNAEKDLKDIKYLLEEYDTFGSTITFKRNSDEHSRSFGSKKFQFKAELKDVLKKMNNQLVFELKELNNKLEKL